MTGTHRDDENNGDTSLEEAILAKIDEAALSAEEPAKQAVQAANTAALLVKIVIVFAFFFSVSSGYAIYKTQQALDGVEEVSKQNSEYLTVGCEDGNTSRASELSFWMGLIKDSAKKPENQTPEKLAERQSYKKKLQETYPQLDCSKVKEGERVVIPPAPGG